MHVARFDCRKLSEENTKRWHELPSFKDEVRSRLNEYIITETRQRTDADTIYASVTLNDHENNRLDQWELWAGEGVET